MKSGYNSKKNLVSIIKEYEMKINENKTTDEDDLQLLSDINDITEETKNYFYKKILPSFDEILDERSKKQNYNYFSFFDIEIPTKIKKSEFKEFIENENKSNKPYIKHKKKSSINEDSIKEIKENTSNIKRKYYSKSNKEDTQGIGEFEKRTRKTNSNSNYENENNNNNEKENYVAENPEKKNNHSRNPIKLYKKSTDTDSPNEIIQKKIKLKDTVKSTYSEYENSENNQLKFNPNDVKEKKIFTFKKKDNTISINAEDSEIKKTEAMDFIEDFSKSNDKYFNSMEQSVKSTGKFNNLEKSTNSKKNDSSSKKQLEESGNSVISMEKIVNHNEKEKNNIYENNNEDENKEKNIEVKKLKLGYLGNDGAEKNLKNKKEINEVKITFGRRKKNSITEQRSIGDFMVNDKSVENNNIDNDNESNKLRRKIEKIEIKTNDENQNEPENQNLDTKKRFHRKYKFNNDKNNK